MQQYDMVKIRRSEMKGAPYNPRVISDAAMRKLKAGIQKIGLLAPPTWNRRTGQIVGGHQRLKVLDALSTASDYELEVAAVDLSPEDEKAANLLLNTDTVTGDFDLDQLAALLGDPTLDLDKTGFDSSDVYKLFGGDPRDANLDTFEALDAVAEKVRAARDRYDALSEKMSSRDSEAFYIVVIFRDNETRDSVLDAMGLEQNRYQDARSLSGKTWPTIE